MRGLLFILIVGLAGLSTACNGKDCSEPPDTSESEERFLDRVEGYLDDADAEGDQEDKILALARDLTPARQKMRKKYEPHRTAILNEMLADQPDLKVIDREVEKAAEAMLGYSDEVVDQGMKAHRILKPEQRKKLGEELAEPPDPFELDWKANTAVDIFMLDIGASDAQKVRIRDELVDVEKGVREVQKKQHDIRLAIIPHIESSTPDPAKIKALVRKGGGYSVGLIQSLARTYVDIMSSLQPEQRDKARSRLSALKRCPAS